MAKIWANRIIAGTKTFAEVPASRKETVKAELISRLGEEKAMELIGE